MADMTDAARFWDKIATRYARSPVADEAAYQHKLDKTRAYLTPESHVLELGCGTGTTALAHAPYAARIEATDISASMLEIASAKAQAAGIDTVTFRQASVDEIDGPARYDMVMAHSLLHLVSDRDDTIGRIHAVLKPGGWFVSSTICMSDGFWFMRPVLPLGRIFGWVPFVAFFSAKALRRSVEQAGFEIVYDWHPGPRKAVFLVARKPE